MHYELLETRKRKIEEQQRLAARETKPFVYKETDFPSILGVQTSRRLRNHGHASAKTNEDDGKYMWITRGKGNDACVW